MKAYPHLTAAIRDTGRQLRNRGVLVHPTRWQSIDVSDKPEMATYELLNHSFQAPISSEDLGLLRDDVQPNLPWADDHFGERVCGQPLNPGVEWKNWPWGHSADKFRVHNGQFDHNYMERYWPKYAGYVRPSKDNDEWDAESVHDPANIGIRFEYGDLHDVVSHLRSIPLSRQAFLPIFFPEDTGKVGVRVPCTLGYHFIMRHGFLHCTYYIRSCDYLRHFRDDIYLTVRLQLWVLDELRKQDERWNDVKPGLFTMHTVSMHLFVNDYIKLWGEKK